MNSFVGHAIEVEAEKINANGSSLIDLNREKDPGRRGVYAEGLLSWV